MLGLLGSAIGGISSLLGGLFGSNKQSDINQQNIQAQEQINAQNIAEQEKFAKTGIQWKVADAKAAGINPLAALGAATQSFSNVVAPEAKASPALGNAIGAAGQNIGNAIARMQTEDQQAYDNATKALTLQKAQLENDYLASQIAVTRAAATPPVPRPDQVFHGGIPAPEMAVKVVPDQVTQGPGGGLTAGVHPEVALSKTAWGGLYPEPSRDMSVAMFNPWSQTAWSFRNMVMPMVSDSFRPPDLRGDKVWYDPFSGYTPADPARPGTIGYYLDRNKWFGNTFQF